MHAPSYLFTVDVGPQGRHDCSIPRSGYEARELEGAQIVCARRSEELVVLAAHSHTGGTREALRALVTTREGAIATRRAALNQLRAPIVTAPESLRAELRRLTRAKLLARCARLRPGRHANPQLRGTAFALRACARRIQAASAEEQDLKREIVRLVQELAPQLLAEPGVGPIAAAQLLISWSHRGRFAGESAFARHAGAAPIPASSGQVIRHRLDRGGDRALNRALHTIVVTRRKHDPATIAYVQRRTSEGKSVREAIRCLKRYLARHFFRCSRQDPTQLDSHRSITNFVPILYPSELIQGDRA